MSIITEAPDEGEVDPNAEEAVVIEDAETVAESEHDQSEDEDAVEAEAAEDVEDQAHENTGEGEGVEKPIEAEATEPDIAEDADSHVVAPDEDVESAAIVVMDTEGEIVGVIDEQGESLALDTEEAAEILEEVEPLTEAVSNSIDAEGVENTVAQPLLIPNDTAYGAGDQYGLDNIQAPQAWDLTTGSATVVIAIVDTGFDLNHPDLASKFTAGYDFVDSDTDPSDPGGEEHGTHVAGIAAAVTNNAAGMAGTSWNSPIMPIRVCDSTGCSDTAIANGIIWAVDNGAKIINLSLGGEVSNSEVVNAVNYANSNGVTVVAAAGNCDLAGYTPGSDQACAVNGPAYLPNVIAVGATDESNSSTSFSSYYTYAGDPVKPEGHQGVDIVAPGAEIYSSVWNDTFVKWDGTSMATPFVSGVAALLASMPDFDTPVKIREALLSTALDLGPAGWDRNYGFGLVQAYDALKYSPPANNGTPNGESNDDESVVEKFIGDNSVMVEQEANGSINFYNMGPSGMTLLDTLMPSQWENAAPGTVLLSTVNTDLGILLYVTVLPSGLLQVQVYSLADGALLSSTIITP